MAIESRSSLFGLTTAVILPLVILAVLAALGIRAQRTAEYARAREEAGAVSASQAKLLSQELNAAIQPIPRFPNPPLPGTPSPADDILDGTDPVALATLRDDPHAGLSPSGLPRRALAALRLDALHPESQSPEDLVLILTNEAPSILTVPALRKLRDRNPEISVPPTWEHIDTLHHLQATRPEGGWISYDGQMWWLSIGGENFVPPSAFTTDGLGIPDYAVALIAPIHTPPPGELLARTPIDFPSSLTLDWILTSPEAIDRSIRQQTRWTFALLGGSFLISAVGLFAILRMVHRERRLNQLKSQFISSVSHELRAPVGSIRLMAEALEEDRVDSPQEFHHLISRESKRLSHLIENVLDFARIEEGRRRYEFEECDLASLTRDTLDLLEPRAKESGHALQVALEPCSAIVDQSALQQAIINLVDNALKFSPEPTPVTIALTSKTSTWSLAIGNKGPGIPQAELNRIFERFHRLGDELRRETEGTGIGLSIVKHIIRAHDGQVTVTSQPGEETIFTLSAPLNPNP